jgi:putative flippase GtrA
MKEGAIFKKFIFCGSVAAFANWSFRLIFNDFLKLNLFYSVLIAHFIGMIIAFFLFKLFVFNTKKDIISSIFPFIIVNVFSLFFIYFATIFLIKIFLLFFSEIILIKGIAYGFAIGLTTLTSYYLHKKFTY